jgi:hypothetical protein
MNMSQCLISEALRFDTFTMVDKSREGLAFNSPDASWRA